MRFLFDMALALNVEGTTRGAALAAIDAFLAEADLSEREFSLRVANNPRLVARLRRVEALTLRSIEEAERFIDEARAAREAAR